MADFIQSKIELFHTMEEKQPTNTNKGTEINQEEELGVNTDKIKAESSSNRFRDTLGRTSTKRRILTYAMDFGLEVYTLQSDKNIFRESLMGDKRGMIKEQQRQVRVKGLVNNAKSLATTVLVQFALKNPALTIAWAANHTVSTAQLAIRQASSRQEMEVLQNKEIFEGSRRRERMIVGVYNRRG